MWSKEKIWEWYQKQPWIVGFNYVPSCAVNSTEMWQKEDFNLSLIEKELQFAASVGYNTCRIFLQYLLWKEKKQEFLECLELFLSAADKCGLKVMPILFDDCAFAGKDPYLGVQNEPIKGVGLSGWTPSPGVKAADDETEEESLQAYVVDIMSRYGKDDRIILWDLYNEPGNNNRKEKCLKLMRNAFAWARSCEPWQPLTTGVWFFEEYEMEFAALSDIVSYHDYEGMEKTVEKVKKLEAYGRPILCTEWLMRLAKNDFETHLPYFKEKGIGSVNWGLVAGKIQTYLLGGENDYNPKEGMPPIWVQDVVYPDLTPYSQKEIDLLMELTGRK